MGNYVVNPLINLGLDKNTNLGNIDLTLTGNRTVTGAYSLDINVTGSAQSRFVKSGDGLILQSSNTRIQKGSNVIRLEAGSITVAAAGSGLGIAYDDRAVDEASVGAWGTTPNHIPSEARIISALAVDTAVKTPTSTGISGQQSYNSGFLYTCVATDVWVREAVDTSW